MNIPPGIPYVSAWNDKNSQLEGNLRYFRVKVELHFTSTGSVEGSGGVLSSVYPQTLKKLFDTIFNVIT